jgi:PadR family transcriptional regulator PadR
MARRNAEGRNDVMPGTLDMLILKTISIQPMHGYGIVQHIQLVSHEVLHVEEGTLYPALQRLQVKGYIESEWLTTPNNRRARYYRLTVAGRKQLAIEESIFDEMVKAVTRVLRTV